MLCCQSNCQQKLDDKDKKRLFLVLPIVRDSISSKPNAVIFFFYLFCSWIQGNYLHLKATSAPGLDYSEMIPRAPPYNCKVATSCSIHTVLCYRKAVLNRAVRSSHISSLLRKRRYPPVNPAHQESMLPKREGSCSAPAVILLQGTLTAGPSDLARRSFEERYLPWPVSKHSWTGTLMFDVSLS